MIIRKSYIAFIVALISCAVPAHVRAQERQADVQPQLKNASAVTKRVKELYPVVLQRAGIGALARVRVFINPKGVPDSVRLEASTGLTALDDAARTAAREARFTTTGWSRAATGGWVTIPIDFGGATRSDLVSAVKLDVANRAEVEAGMNTLYPREMSQLNVGTDVGLSLVVDSAGNVVDQLAVLPSCLPIANGAAAAATKQLKFSAAKSAHVRQTFVTVGFSRDSLDLTLMGDTFPRDTTHTDSVRPGPKPRVVRPELQNREHIARVLVTEYPPALRDQGIGGTVIAWFRVEPDGRVSHRRVRVGSGYCELDMAALRVAAAMKFSPAKRGDETIPVWIEVPIQFTVR
jgi:TonB family protein